MPQFTSGHSYLEFIDAVLYQHRYVHSDDIRDFLAALVETAHSRSKLIPVDSIFWRAQLGANLERREITRPDLTYSYDEDVPFDAKRMVPRRNVAREGRVNPKGVPCLYLATDKETAMSEIRPWLGARISVANFRTIRELRLVDCSRHHDIQLTPERFFERGPSESVTDTIWVQIDRAFSKPVNSDDLETADYVPTQIMAEAFRQAGFDGVEFKSKLATGNSVALFDVDSASVSEIGLFKAIDVAYRFEDMHRDFAPARQGFSVEYSPRLCSFLQQTPEEFERDARLAMAVKMFEMRRLSSGQAAQLAGIARADFLACLPEYGVAAKDLPSDEPTGDVRGAGPG